MSVHMSELTELLKTKQVAENLTGAAMALKLGVSEAMWSYIASGQRRIGLETLQGIVRTWPELNLQVIEYIRNGN